MLMMDGTTSRQHTVCTSTHTIFRAVDFNLHYGDRSQFHLKLVGMTALEGPNYKWLKNS